jgi:hypothetical protein
MEDKHFRAWYKSPVDPAYTFYVYTYTRKEARLVLNALIDYNLGLFEDGFKDKGDGGIYYGIERLALRGPDGN